MLIEVLKSKMHRFAATEANFNYTGSITTGEALMEAANLVEGEKVQVVNINNGERLETYVIKGKRDGKDICLNGPAARKVMAGDIIIVINYALMNPEEVRQFKPLLVFPETSTNSLISV